MCSTNFSTKSLRTGFFNPLNANPTNASNTLKQFVGYCEMLKGLTECQNRLSEFVKS